MITDYLALDLETTGLSPDKDRVIEIGAVKYHEGKRKEQYSCLVRIGMPLPERITKLTGITQEMLAEGVSEQEANLPPICQYCLDIIFRLITVF